MNEPTLSNKFLNSLPTLLFVLTLTGSSYLYGVMSNRFNLFPNNLVNVVYKQLQEIKNMLFLYDLWIYTKKTNQQPVYDHPDKTQPGLTKLTGYGNDGVLITKLVNQKGETVHEWNVDWFVVWPDATHLPDQDLPQARPGTTIHGAVVTPEGGLIYNYEKMGLVHLDVCSNIVWRLPRMTHHSLFLDEERNLWVPDLHKHLEEVKSWPNHEAPFREFRVLKVSLQGEVLEEFSLMDVLQSNGLQGLFYMQTAGKYDISATGDTLHLNDIEIFPSTMSPGVFAPGDIMVSLRNLNAVIVFSPEDKKVKYTSIGKYVRQHDPDFIDGNSFSVFDNNNLKDLVPEPYSRIMIESAVDGSVKEYYAGAPGKRFFTKVFGKHQWLDNGNLLITGAMEGRAIEVDQQKNIVWQHYNTVSDEYIGSITEAERLPQELSQAFFEQAAQRCKNEN